MTASATDIGTTMYRIKHLTPNDVEVLQDLNTLFGRIFDDVETYCAKRPTKDYLKSLLAKEHVVALVALADGELVGGLIAYELEKFEQARREVYIYDLAVAPTHRRQGVATALIRHLQDIASRREAWVIFVQADYGDDPAIALYSKLGTREDVLHFDIGVTDMHRSA
jgi:aminoglycoside 3-N-acetyltransferase I